MIQFIPTISFLPSSPPSQEITPTDDYGRHGRPQPPSPMSPSGLSPIKEVLPRPLLNAKTTTYGRPSNPPPPSPKEAPPTDEVSVTMIDSVWAASTGLRLEISTPKPSLSSTWTDFYSLESKAYIVQSIQKEDVLQLKQYLVVVAGNRICGLGVKLSIREWAF